MTNSFGRRDFITLLGSTAAAWPLAAQERWVERTQRKRIGILMNFPVNDREAPIRVAAFMQRLQELGWTDRRNAYIDYRLTQNDSVQRDAAELIELMPDVLVVNGGSVLKAVQQTTKTIPTVFVNVIDPVGQGFVQSLAHPGGNVTGFSNVEPQMGEKWLRLLREIAPNVTQVAVVHATAPRAEAGIETAIQAAAPSLGVKLIPFTARIAAEIEHDIITLGQRPSLLGPQVFQRANTGLLVLPGAITRAFRERIVELAAGGKLPAIYPYRYYVTDGGLMSYGVDTADAYRRAAGYTDRILKGEKPTDLPVEQATKFELVINVKAAKALGLDVPETLLAMADEVIG
jgi:putative ABC transport system substrate-binding protein